MYKRSPHWIYKLGLVVCLLENSVKDETSRKYVVYILFSNNKLQMAAILRCYADYITKSKFLIENLLCLHANVCI